MTAVDKKVNLNMTSRDLIRYTGEIILLGSDSQSVQGLIPPQVNLSGVWYPTESICPGSDTPASQSVQGLKPLSQSVRSMIPQQVNLSRVWYPSKSICPGSDTPASQSARGLIPQRINLSRVWYPSKSICPGSDTDTPAS